jgi:hypothetical protein
MEIIHVLVAIPGLASQAPNPAYNVENFTYSEKGDFYLCPQGEKLTTPGTWHKTRTYYFKRCLLFFVNTSSIQSHFKPF